MSRTVQIEGARLPAWVAGFVARHGDAAITATDEGPHLRGADGSTAQLVLPFLPWSSPAAGSTAGSAAGSAAGSGSVGQDPAAAIAAACAHLDRRRRVAVLLLRRGGYACAAVDGRSVAASKVGSRHVQSRTAAGGWSQQRFARRRANQADALAEAVVEVAVRVLLPIMTGAAPIGGAWLATGGDRPLLDRVLGDRRLRDLSSLPRGPHLALGDPKAATVAALPTALHQVLIRLVDPDSVAGQD